MRKSPLPRTTRTALERKGTGMGGDGGRGGSVAGGVAWGDQEEHFMRRQARAREAPDWFLAAMGMEEKAEHQYIPDELRKELGLAKMDEVLELRDTVEKRLV